jgi:hypothetical protein
MMHRVRRWFVFLMMLAVIAGAMWLWWEVDLRGDPHTIKKDQAALAAALQRAGWVSPHINGKIVYVLVTGECPACEKFETGPLEALETRGVDTRIIVVAPPDKDGKAMSTAADRAAVAEFWINRDWSLYKRWREPSPTTMAGIAPADGDAARTAVVQAAQASAATIQDALKRNGVARGYPVAIWWNKAGDMRASLVDNGAAARKAEREVESG